MSFTESGGGSTKAVLSSTSSSLFTGSGSILFTRRTAILTAALIAGVGIASYLFLTHQSDQFTEKKEELLLTDSDSVPSPMGQACSNGSDSNGDLTDPLLRSRDQSVSYYTENQRYSLSVSRMSTVRGGIPAAEIAIETDFVVPLTDAIFEHTYEAGRKRTVLESIRAGDFHCRIDHIEEDELRYSLSLVCALICRVPFEMGTLKQTLLYKFRNRLKQSKALKQSFEFFLCSFASHPAVRMTFEEEYTKWKTKMKRYADFYDQLTVDKTSRPESTKMGAMSSVLIEDFDDVKSPSDSLSGSSRKDDRSQTTGSDKPRKSGRGLRKLFGSSKKKEASAEPPSISDMGSTVSEPPKTIGLADGKVSTKPTASVSVSSDITTTTTTTTMSEIHSRDDSLMKMSSEKSKASEIDRKNIHKRKRSASVSDLSELAGMFDAPNIVIEDRCITIGLENTIEFYFAIFRVAPMPGFRVVIDNSGPSKVEIFHPWDSQHNVVQLQVRKIFSSNAKPVLMDCYVEEPDLLSIDNEKRLTLSPYSLIMKRGDDLRKDQAVLQMFSFMNHLWSENVDLCYNDHYCKAQTYKCTPMSLDFGCIELIDKCKTLKDIKSMDFSSVKKKSNLITSAAGSYIASYVMGIRDRHYDNVLIRDDGLLFHIDFGYALGETLGGLDAASIAITKEMQSVMHAEWKLFCDLCASAFIHLRRHYDELLNYAKIVFYFIFESSKIESFLYNQLRMSEKDDVVHKQISEKINRAPSHYKTKIKNRMHAIAQMR